jgi:hypothetical protein
MQELLGHYFRRFGSFMGFLAWVGTAVMIAPIVLTFLVAWQAPELIDSFVKERNTPALAPYWQGHTLVPMSAQLELLCPQCNPN